MTLNLLLALSMFSVILVLAAIYGALARIAKALEEKPRMKP